MTDQVRPRVKYVIGPDGSPLTIADLPPTDTKRWVIRRKAEVVAAVRGGLLSLEEACNRYTLTVEEFLAWQQSIDRHGLAGLRTTRIQQYDITSNSVFGERSARAGLFSFWGRARCDDSQASTAAVVRCRGAPRSPANRGSDPHSHSAKNSQRLRRSHAGARHFFAYFRIWSTPLTSRLP
jgi:hypothetical protein